MHILTAFLFIGMVWKWGDWRNWGKYYPTILFVWVCNLLYNFLCYDYYLWKWSPDWLSNHIQTDLIYIFITVPAIALLYLSRYPEQCPFKKKFMYFSSWVLVFVLIEVVWLWFDKLIYYHGWTLGWSFVFYIIMFLIIRIHYTKPLIAIPLTLLAVIFFIWVFKIPLHT